MHCAESCRRLKSLRRLVSAGLQMWISSRRASLFAWGRKLQGFNGCLIRWDRVVQWCLRRGELKKSPNIYMINWTCSRRTGHTVNMLEILLYNFTFSISFSIYTSKLKTAKRPRDEKEVDPMFREWVTLCYSPELLDWRSPQVRADSIY